MAILIHKRDSGSHTYFEYEGPWDLVALQSPTQKVEVMASPLSTSPSSSNLEIPYECRMNKSLGLSESGAHCPCVTSTKICVTVRSGQLPQG